MRLFLAILICLPALGGTCLRVIEATLPIEARDALDLHAADLQAAGWKVQDAYVAPSDAKAPLGAQEIARTVVWPAIRAHGSTWTNVLHVFFIGDLPLPRSGFAQNPDGHHDTSGAYPAPVYYAMPDAVWTDERDNTAFRSRPLQQNRPGDGRFDQDRRPAGEIRAAIGILNLTPAIKNRSWGYTGSQSLWEAQAYRRYFDALHCWRTGQLKPKHPWGVGSGLGQPSTQWLNQTDAQQPTWRSTSSPGGFEACTPFGAVYDFKGVPANGTFWFTRTAPVAAVYFTWESYQSDASATRIINPLMTGSVASAPIGFAWSLAGWQTNTLGQLWIQSAAASPNPWVALYGDPTFRLANKTQ